MPLAVGLPAMVAASSLGKTPATIGAVTARYRDGRAQKFPAGAKGLARDSRRHIGIEPLFAPDERVSRRAAVTCRGK